MHFSSVLDFRSLTDQKVCNGQIEEKKVALGAQTFLHHERQDDERVPEHGGEHQERHERGHEHRGALGELAVRLRAPPVLQRVRGSVGSVGRRPVGEQQRKRGVSGRLPRGGHGRREPETVTYGKQRGLHAATDEAEVEVEVKAEA